MTKHCEKHGDYEERRIAALPYAGPAFDLVEGCPLCAKEAVEREAAEERRAAEERKRARLEAMNIEPAYFGASFDNFEASTPELAHNLERVRDLVEGRIQKVVMLGKNGTGKTHLACAALKVLGGKIMSMYEISTTIRASYTAIATRTELEIVNELARLPLLAIDEIGRTKGGDAEANWLSYIIDKRHVRGLPLILISNKHAQKDCERGGCSDCLENYIGEDIMSRLCEGGALLKFTGNDYRKQSRKAA
jgi:DNA replication protein DnaC